MPPRVIVPELLDEMDPSHPDALRSRADLRRLDAYLGNSRWIVREVAALGRVGVVELGAGDGRLCRQLPSTAASVTGLDLVPDPGIPRVAWRRGDFFETLGEETFDVVVACLVLHHFDDARLAVLGRLVARARHLVFVEPLRHPFPLAGSLLAHPFVGRVTRHDMPVSIRAGFLPGELGGLLGLDPAEWEITERLVWRGTVRFRATRR